ncbi:MAG: hypothetical protein LBE13_19125 [Bacteroidales bacterium]|jgi:hypothetical protein|nr:hypothetical protein [Bacteroidales bacterium]
MLNLIAQEIQEIQEIRRYLTEEKPLPNKCLFLLFDDKRGIKLVWNIKANNVSNIVLSIKIIEQIDEPKNEEPHHFNHLFGADNRGRQKDVWSYKLN